MTKRDEARERTMEALLASARAEFDTYGYEHSDLRSIARNAGFSTGAIYRIWDGKADLFRAVYPDDYEVRLLSQAIQMALFTAKVTRYHYGMDRMTRAAKAALASLEGAE